MMGFRVAQSKDGSEKATVMDHSDLDQDDGTGGHEKLPESG